MKFPAAVGLCGVVAFSACNSGGLVISRMVEARALASEVRTAFAHASDKTNEAVMADTDQASTMAAHEAQDSRAALEAAVKKLEPLLAGLSYGEEAEQLKAFKEQYAAYAALDNQILELAVENSNLKAQRLLFGPMADASRTLREGLARAVRASPSRSADRAAVQAEAAAAAVLEVQAIAPRHIAESDDQQMNVMETAMGERLSAAEQRIAALAGALPAAAKGDLESARGALGEFKKQYAEMVVLSRRNTNVRSLALTLGKKRTLAAECQATLAALIESLSKHQLGGSR